MNENALNRLLGAGKLEVLFQPIVALSDGSVYGAEALIRWASCTEGMKRPSQFLPQIAAHLGLGWLTRRVLLRSLAAVREWRRIAPGMTVTVNVTGEDCASPTFSAFVASALARYDVPPDALHIEVPEGERLVGNRDVVRGLNRLADFGVGIAIDDFGAGYASLQHLLELPAHILKLDRVLIRQFGQCRRAAAIVQKTIELARVLGMSVVAEGIESEQQRRFLAREGCTYGQGYHLGIPSSCGTFQNLVLEAKDEI